MLTIEGKDTNPVWRAYVQNLAPWPRRGVHNPLQAGMGQVSVLRDILIDLTGHVSTLNNSWKGALAGRVAGSDVGLSHPGLHAENKT